MSDLRRVEFHMGTAIDLDIKNASVSEEELSRIADLMFARLVEIDHTFSTYIPSSEVSQLGRGEIELSQCSAEVRYIVDLAEKLTDTTAGYFDIYAAASTYPANEIQQSDRPGSRALEPSGIVKGWAIQEAVDLLRRYNLYDFCVNAGGDIFASGRPDSDSKWRVGLQHPHDKLKVMAVLEVSDTAVATSGFYNRGEHIVRPQGVQSSADLSAPDLVSLTIVGADITLADAYATAAFAMGYPGMEWAGAQPGFHVFGVDALGLTHRSPGMNDYLVS